MAFITGSTTGVRDQGLTTRENPQHMPPADFGGAGTLIEQVTAKAAIEKAKGLPVHRVVIESH